jgi:hypothetical protein
MSADNETAVEADRVPTEREVWKMSRPQLVRTAVKLFPEVFADRTGFDATFTPFALWAALTGDGWYLNFDYVAEDGNDGPEVFAKRGQKPITVPIRNTDDPVPDVLRVAVLCRRYDLRGDKG